MLSVQCSTRRLIVATLVLEFGAIASAGDFTPPAGPVGPTMKNLDSVEPRIPVGPDTTPGDATAVYVISAPGSYYLTEDTFGDVGKDGIRIAFNNVTLDLNGFTLRGVMGSGSGIRALGAGGIHVTNGSIVSWDGAGVEADQAFGSAFDGLTIESCGSVGLHVAAASTVHNCRARFCGAEGFRANGAATFAWCVSRENAAGFLVSAGITADHCVATYNTGVGFTAPIGTLTDCRATNNSGAGFSLGGGGDGAVVVRGCVAEQNADGFVVGALSGDMAVIDHCIARLNVTDGFHLLWAATIDSCAASRNDDDGFQLPTGASCVDCVSRSNGFGFYVPPGAANTRIESCTATSNAHYGVLISGSGCLVVRNVARANSDADFNFAGLGQYGPVETATGILAADPWANFGDSSVKALSPSPEILRKDEEARRESGAISKAPQPLDAPR